MGPFASWFIGNRLKIKILVIFKKLYLVLTFRIHRRVTQYLYDSECTIYKVSIKIGINHFFKICINYN